MFSLIINAMLAPFEHFTEEGHGLQTRAPEDQVWASGRVILRQEYPCKRLALFPPPFSRKAFFPIEYNGSKTDEVNR